MVEGAALEMLYRGNFIEGSNPSLSAKYLQAPKTLGALLYLGYRETA